MTMQQQPVGVGRPALTGGRVIGSFVALLWLVELADLLLPAQLDRYGIRPGSDEGLLGIVWAPLLHGGFGHLLANTIPLLVLGYLIVISGVRPWLLATAVIWVVGGLGTWLTGGVGSVHIGASGLVFGWLTYLLSVGVFTRRVGQILLGLLVFAVYGGMLWGVLPGQPGISWQGHLFGAVGGVVAAWLVGRRRSTRSQSMAGR